MDEQTEIDWGYEINEFVGWGGQYSPVMEEVRKFIKPEYNINELIDIYTFSQQIAPEHGYERCMYGYLCFAIVAYSTYQWLSSLDAAKHAQTNFRVDSLIEAVWYNFYSPNNVTIQLLDAVGIDYTSRLNDPDFDSVMQYNPQFIRDERRSAIKYHNGDINKILVKYGLEMFISPEDYGTTDLVEMRVALLRDIRDKNPSFVLNFEQNQSEV